MSAMELDLESPNHKSARSAHLGYECDCAVFVPRPVDDLVRDHVAKTMAFTGDNKTQAAKLLGIDRRTLYRWLEKGKSGHCRKRHGVEPPTDD